jgi:acetolactate decarboxylase
MRIPMVIAASLLAASQSYQVKWVGEMRKVMMLGEDQGVISLASLKTTEHLYALGPLEGLNGEITVFDSQAFIGTVRDGHPHVEQTFDVRAPLLVWVEVAKWSAEAASFDSLDSLDKLVEARARAARLDMTRPIPFRVTGVAQAIQMHIVNRQGREAKGREAHEAMEVKFPLHDTGVELLGFWSNRHGGVFTHMGSNLHVHGRTRDNRVSGHVDSVRIDSGQLWLPAARSEPRPQGSVSVERFFSNRRRRHTRSTASEENV